MISVDLTGVDAVQKAFREAREATLTRWHATTRRHSLRAVRTIQTRHRSASATSPTATRVGTGHLRASYAQVTNRVAHGVESAIGLMRLAAQGKALVYGAVHEEGGVIRSKSGKMLAIPLPSIRSPSGVAPPTSAFPRSETFVIKGKFGGGIIARRLGGKNGTIQPLFLLRREVRIPARPTGGAINAVMAETLPALQADLERDVLAAVGSR